MLSSWHACFVFEPCEEYYKSEGLSASFSSLFAKNAFSVFEFKQVPLNRRQRRMASAAHSGKPMAMAVQPAKEATAKNKSLMRNRRVVVTGRSVVSPIGHDADMFYSNLLESVSGISQIEAFDCSEFPSRIAGEIKEFSTDGWVAPKLSKRADKFMLCMLSAGKKALADAGITEDLLPDSDKASCGVLIGSALGGMKVFHDGIEALQGWMGPSYSISTACATSNFCVLSAANHIIRGETDMMLFGGVRLGNYSYGLVKYGLGGFTACGALSQRNSDPTTASRPWDVDRDGFVIGEVSGVLLLEELELAKKRKAKIYAEFLGGSFTSDAYHMIEPHP